MIRLIILAIDVFLCLLSIIYDPEVENPKYTKSRFIRFISRHTVNFIIVFELIWTSFVVQFVIKAIRESLIWR